MNASGGLSWGARAVTAAFVVSGVVHLVRPQVFEPIVPPLLGPPRPWVTGSGVAELVCAAGLLHPRSRSWAAPAAAGLLVAVWPANLQMTLDALGSARRRGGRQRWIRAVVSAARLPLQVPMIRWMLAARPRAQA